MTFKEYFLVSEDRFRELMERDVKNSKSTKQTDAVTGDKKMINHPRTNGVRIVLALLML